MEVLNFRLLKRQVKPNKSDNYTNWKKGALETKRHFYYAGYKRLYCCYQYFITCEVNSKQTNKQLRSAVSNAWPTSSFYVVIALFLFKLQNENCLSVKQFISFLCFKTFIRKERNEGRREGRPKNFINR